MTATIKPPDRRSAPRRPIRFSSMESLGFSDATSIWSDTPETRGETVTEKGQGRHVAPVPRPDTVADWRPNDFGARLDGGNVRWGLVTFIAIILVGMALAGYWLYQRPAAEQAGAQAEVSTRASALESAIPSLEGFAADLLTADGSIGTEVLFEVESEARGLFETSSALAGDSGLRAASADAAGSALDGIRLAHEAYAFRAALLPVLIAPDLETDHTLIELDDAARSFGDWQMTFDDVRSALPEGTLSDVRQDVDVLSSDLTSIMGRYVDALRADDSNAAAAVLSDLRLRLDKVEDTLSASIEDVQARITARIAETRSALSTLLDRQP